MAAGGAAPAARSRVIAEDDRGGHGHRVFRLVVAVLAEAAGKTADARAMTAFAAAIAAHCWCGDGRRTRAFLHALARGRRHEVAAGNHDRRALALWPYDGRHSVPTIDGGPA